MARYAKATHKMGHGVHGRLVHDGGCLFAALCRCAFWPLGAHRPGNPGRDHPSPGASVDAHAGGTPGPSAGRAAVLTGFAREVPKGPSLCGSDLRGELCHRGSRSAGDGVACFGGPRCRAGLRYSGGAVDWRHSGGLVGGRAASVRAASIADAPELCHDFQRGDVAPADPHRVHVGLCQLFGDVGLARVHVLDSERGGGRSVFGAGAGEKKAAYQ